MSYPIELPPPRDANDPTFWDQPETPPAKQRSRTRVIVTVLVGAVVLSLCGAAFAQTPAKHRAELAYDVGPSGPTDAYGKVSGYWVSRGNGDSQPLPVELRNKLAASTYALIYKQSYPGLWNVTQKPFGWVVRHDYINNTTWWIAVPPKVVGNCTLSIQPQPSNPPTIGVLYDNGAGTAYHVYGPL